MPRPSPLEVHKYFSYIEIIGRKQYFAIHVDRKFEVLDVDSMSLKRKDRPYTALNSKRFRSSAFEGDDDGRTPQPKVDPTYGQRGAFPDIEIDNDESLFYGPANDGLEYLRMVRSEAKTVPTLLIAPSLITENSDQSPSDPLGYYADGAYTAAPRLANGSAAQHGGDEDIDPQEAYYVSLLARFGDLSTTLQNPPPADLIALSVASTAQDINTGYSSRWRSTFNTQPSMVLISLLAQETVLQGLRMLETRLTIERLSESQSLGVWVWGLLGRCRDAGQMGSEEIGILRDLGKKAIWLLRVLKAGLLRVDDEEGSRTNSDAEFDGNNEDFEATRSSDLNAGMHVVEPLSTPAMSDLKEETAQTTFESGLDSQTADGLEAARANLLASLPSGSTLPTIRTPARASPPVKASSPPPTFGVHGSSEAPDSQQAIDQITRTHAVLDMIITIVGECYGQRDLLDGRIVWGELEYA